MWVYLRLNIMCVLQVLAPRLDVTLSDLQDLATRQQQQIDAQQQLLASKVQLRICCLRTRTHKGTHTHTVPGPPVGPVFDP